MQSINEKYSSTFMDEYQKNIDSYLRINGAKIEEDRGAIAGTMDNVVVGKAMVEMWESTLPKEFKSVTLSQQAKNLQKYSKAISMTDEEANELRESRKNTRKPDATLVLRSLGEEEIKKRISKTIEDIGVTTKEIQKFDEQLASSDLNRDLIDAGSQGVPELINAIGALAGDQIARIPTMLVGGSFISEVGNHYWDNVQAVAEQKGMSPQEVIESGLADPAIAEFTGKLSGSLEYAGMGKIVGVLKNAVKNTVKKNLVQVLASGGVEGITEGLQGVVGQASQGAATGETKFDLYSIANEALAGATMGMIFAAPGVAKSANSRSYSLNGQEVSRKTAQTMIEEGTVDGLEIQNDAALEAKAKEVSPESRPESGVTVKTKEEAIQYIKENTDQSDVEVEKTASEVESVAKAVAEQDGITMEEAYEKVDIENRIKKPEKDTKTTEKTPKIDEKTETGDQETSVGVEEEVINEGDNQDGDAATTTESEREGILNRREEIISRLKNNTGDKLSSGIDPKVVADYVKLAKTYIDEGVVNIKEFSTQFKERVKELLGIDLEDNVVDQVYKEATAIEEAQVENDVAPSGTAINSGESFDLGIEGVEGSFKEKKSGSIQLMAKKEGKKVGFFNFRPVNKDGGKYYSIQDVAVNPKEEGKGIGTQMYRQLMSNLPDDIDGVISPSKSRKNKEQVPSIHKKLSNEYDTQILENGDVVFSKKKEVVNETLESDVVKETISLRDSISNMLGVEDAPSSIDQTINNDAAATQTESSTSTPSQPTSSSKNAKTRIDTTTGVRKLGVAKKAFTTKELIRGDVKTARDAKNWVINNQKTITKFLKDNLDESGPSGVKLKNINIKKAMSLMNKIVSAPKTDLQMKRSIKQIHDIIAKQGVVNYRTQARGLRKRVSSRKNQLRGAESSIQDLLQVDPINVPISKQSEYINLLGQLSAPGIPPGRVMSKIKGMVDSIQESALNNQDTMLELAEKFKYQMALSKKATDEDLISAVLDDMGIIGSDREVQRNFMKDHLSDIKKMSKDPLINEQITKEEANFDLTEIKAYSEVIKPDQFDENLGKIVQVFKNIKESDLVDFSRAELKNLSKVLDSLNYGFAPVRMRAFHDKIIARRNFNELKASVNSFMEIPKSFSMDDLIKKNKDIQSRDQLVKQMERAHLQNIEYMIGRVRDNKVYSKIISPIVRNVEKANQESDRIHKMLSHMFEGGKGGISASKSKFTNILMNMIMKEREFSLNPDNNKVYSVKDHMEALMGSSVNLETKELYKSVYDKYSNEDGFDLIAATAELRKTKLKKPFKIGKTEIINADDITVWMRSVLDGDMRGKAIFIKNNLEDEAFTTWDGYFPQKAINVVKEEVNDLLKTSQSGATSYKSSNLKARANKASPIKFDAYGNFEKAVRSLNTQFYLQQSLNESQATLNLMQRVGDEKTKQIAGALQETLNTSIAHELASWDALGVRGFKVLNHVMKKIYNNETMQTIASVSKAVSELVSNHLGLLKLDNSDKLMKKSIQNIITLKNDKELMNKVSKVMSMHSSTHSSRLGRISDEREHRSSIDQQRMQSTDKSNKFLDAYIGAMENRAVNAVTGFIEDFNKKLISFGDSVMIKPVWWNSFTEEFNKISGTNISVADFDSKSFRIKYDRQIQEAVAVADKQTALVVNTGSAFETSIRDKAWRRHGLLRYGTFLKGFMTNEVFILRDALHSLIGKKGTFTKSRALKVIAGQMLQQSMYSVVRSALLSQFYSLMSSMAGWDEPEDKDEIEQIKRIGMDLLLTNSIGHWNSFSKTGLLYGAKMLMDHMDADDLSELLYAPDLNYTQSVLRNYGGVAGVVAKDAMDLKKYGGGTISNLFSGQIEDQDIHTLLPLLRLTTGVPMAKDLESIKDTQIDKPKKSSSSGNIDMDSFMNNILSGDDFEGNEFDDNFGL